jgi:hypothetical protein
LINAVDGAQRELDAHRQAHLAQQGQRLANGGRPDQRPAEPVELHKAEQRLTDAQRAAAAANAVLADHETALSAAARHVSAMTVQRDETYKDAILAIVGEHIVTGWWCRSRSSDAARSCRLAISSRPRAVSGPRGAALVAVFGEPASWPSAAASAHAAGAEAAGVASSRARWSWKYSVTVKIFLAARGAGCVVMLGRLCVAKVPVTVWPLYRNLRCRSSKLRHVMPVSCPVAG